LTQKKPLEALYHLYVLASNHLPQLLDCMECISTEEEDENNKSMSPILKDLYQQISQLVDELQRSVGLAEAVLSSTRSRRTFVDFPPLD